MWAYLNRIEGGTGKGASVRKKPTRHELAVMENARKMAKRQAEERLRRMHEEQSVVRRVVAGRFDPMNPKALGPEPGPPPGLIGNGWKP